MELETRLIYRNKRPASRIREILSQPTLEPIG